MSFDIEGDSLKEYKEENDKYIVEIPEGIKHIGRFCFHLYIPLNYLLQYQSSFIKTSQKLIITLYYIISEMKSKEISKN